MFKNTDEKAFLTWVRIQDMEVMKWCLNKFKETEDDMYWEFAKKFGGWSKHWKKEIELLD
jgi:hypothetical protein